MEGHHHHHEDGSCDHDHKKGGIHLHPVTENLKIAFWLNLVFTIIEVAGGLWTNSVAVLSDAVHDFGDLIAIGSAIFLEQYSRKKRDRRFSYGYRRFSPLAAFLNSVILLAGSLFIIAETIPRLLKPQVVYAPGMIALAVLGILMNGAAVLRLRKSSGASSRAVMLHLTEDVLGWSAVLLGGMVMHFWDFPIIDPILSVCIALYILWNAGKNLRSLYDVFLQAVPENIDIEAVCRQIEARSDVLSVHDVHSWSLDGDYHVLSMHIRLPGDTNREKILSVKKEAGQIVRKAGFAHYTFQLDYEGEDCGFPD